MQHTTSASRRICPSARLSKEALLAHFRCFLSPYFLERRLIPNTVRSCVPSVGPRWSFWQVFFCVFQAFHIPVCFSRFSFYNPCSRFPIFHSLYAPLTLPMFYRLASENAEHMSIKPIKQAGKCHPLALHHPINSHVTMISY